MDTATTTTAAGRRCRRPRRGRRRPHPAGGRGADPRGRRTRPPTPPSAPGRTATATSSAPPSPSPAGGATSTARRWTSRSSVGSPTVTRIGSLVLNPGGPGRVRGRLRGGLRRRRPARRPRRAVRRRGLGPPGHGPVRGDRLHDRRAVAGAGARPDPRRPGRRRRPSGRRPRRAAAACTRDEGDLLEVVGTRATARDLDALRGALGDARLTYVGYSYGTTIGMEYLRLYPGRVRAMVLDGVAVPGGRPHHRRPGPGRRLRAHPRRLPGRLPQPLRLPPGRRPQGGAARPRRPAGAGAPPRRLLPRGRRCRPPGGRARRRRALHRHRLVPLHPGVLAHPRPGAHGGPRCRPVGADAARPPRRLPGPPGRRDVGRRRRLPRARSAAPTRRPARPRPRGTSTWPPSPGPTSCRSGARGSRWGRRGAGACPTAVEPLAPLAEGDLAGAPPVVVIGTTNDPATPYEQSEEAARIIEGRCWSPSSATSTPSTAPSRTASTSRSPPT